MERVTKTGSKGRDRPYSKRDRGWVERDRPQRNREKIEGDRETATKGRRESGTEE